MLKTASALLIAFVIACGSDDGTDVEEVYGQYTVTWEGSVGAPSSIDSALIGPVTDAQGNLVGVGVSYRENGSISFGVTGTMDGGCINAHRTARDTEDITMLCMVDGGGLDGTYQEDASAATAVHMLQLRGRTDLPTE